MPIPIAVPRLGWNMEEGTFLDWLKADGEAVRTGDRLYRFEGDKSVEEIEALDGGILSIPSAGPQPGDRVAVGTIIGHLLQPGDSPSVRAEPISPKPFCATDRAEVPSVEPAAGPSIRRLAREKGVDLRSVQGTGQRERVTVADVERSARPVTPGGRLVPTISPRAKCLAARHGLDWARIRGSGRTGRIREQDVAEAIRLGKGQSHEVGQPSTAHLGGGKTAKPDIIPHSSTRRAIAARMAESHRSTAAVTLTSTVDASNLVNLRGQFKAVDDGGIVPSYTDFLIKLVAHALQKHPLLSASWTDDALQLADRIDIGLAVDADAGLLVPIIRDVPALGLRQIAARSKELIDRVRSGQLASRDMEGGCFTITNLGAYGIDAFTPIVNLPQSAILGVGRIERRPVVDGDRVVGREMVTLSLTFDHRVVDGAPAARFLQTLALSILNPAPWLSS